MNNAKEFFENSQAFCSSRRQYRLSNKSPGLFVTNEKKYSYGKTAMGVVQIATQSSGVIITNVINSNPNSKIQWRKL